MDVTVIVKASGGESRTLHARLRVMTTALLLTLCSQVVRTQGGAPVSAGSAAAPPPPAIEFGIEERFRYEHTDNLLDHDAARPDLREVWRFRTRVWANGSLGRRASFGVALTNESQGQGEPPEPLRLDETVFSALWVNFRPHPRLNVRLGRQSLHKGDGLILHDGTPGDGSRTDYVNGLNASVTLARDATLDVLALWDPGSDSSLPVVHDQHRRVAEWEQRLAGVYLTRATRPGRTWHAYALFMQLLDDRRPSTHPQYLPDRTIGTFGGRVEVTAGRTSVVGEGALQAGSQAPGRRLRAWAATASAQRRLEAPWRPTVRVALAGLSGDAPGTDTVERWEPVLGRWPLWSEGTVQALGPERGPAYWSNMGMLTAEVLLTPSPRSAARVTYRHLTAFHPHPGPAVTFGTGTTRGGLVQARFDLAMHARLRGYVLYERLAPGAFYAGRSPGHLLRVELLASWQHRR